MKRLWNWLLHKISFFIALAVIIVTLCFVPRVLETVLEWNETHLLELFEKISIGWTSYLGVVWFAKWVGLVLEVWGTAIITAVIVRGIVNSVFGWANESKISEILRILSMFVAALCNIVMAFYAYSILWGDATIGGHVFFKMYDPATLNFNDGVWIGLVGALYALSQAIPFLFHPGAGVGWQMISITTSIPMLGMIGWTWLVYRFSVYDWTTYKIAALHIWGVIESLDVVNIAIIFWLSRRTIVAASSTEETKHDH